MRRTRSNIANVVDRDKRFIYNLFTPSIAREVSIERRAGEVRTVEGHRGLEQSFKRVVSWRGPKGHRVPLAFLLEFAYSHSSYRLT